MLNTLFRRRATPAASLPAGLRVYAIGDIHGRLDLLDQLIGQIDRDADGLDTAEIVLVFLGDLIDRGPDSAGVVERVRQLSIERPSTRCLLGNHEEVFLLALDGDERALRAFCRIGGRETLLSYGIREDEYNQLDYHDMAQRLTELVPPAHRIFLEGCEDMVVLGDYVFVHAGVDPATGFENQRGADLRWIRSAFLNHRQRLEKMVIHGHTISVEPEFRQHRIGIDTGAYETGRLTALGLQEERTWYLQTSAESGQPSR